ncbi:Carbonic anhydrase, alpha class [hydrothermal vent metagenome]|uniref:carbonic anhydrase n=1 Tax=hydrothermal vent metagenome TaxID=652676 RepID=A0A3B0RG14_9ZZZZ
MTKKKSFVSFLAIFALALLIGFATYQPSEASSKKSSGHGSSHGESKSHAKPHWSYEGKYGPSHWGTMLSEYSACGKGKRQSPINITRASEAELSPLKFKYRKSKSLTILNNGHAIQINQRKGSLLYLDGTEFDLLQVHFHSPSEHNVDGESFPMEAHFVHADKDGNLGVVGLMIKVGSHNKALDNIWKVLPKTKKKEKLSIAYDIDELLPTDKSYYRYAGSLTTPPCTESVTWLVLKSPIEISKDQLKAYRKILHKTNRPIQGRNNRLVLD